MKKFTADFETNVQEDDCRVWAYALCEIGDTTNFIYGNNIEDFIKFCSNPKENYILYFHNLKFDGEYIFSYLLNNGYTCIKNKEERTDKTFTCLISDMGQFYSIEIFFDCSNLKHINKVTIYDSLKILNFSVDKVAKCFNLPIRKLEIDYIANREKDHILTLQEVDYIRNDVEIMARALDIMFKENLTKMTIGSDALYNYKEMSPNFNKYFPQLDYQIHYDLKPSYRGGFTYLNEIYKESTVDEGIVLDVNSLYPSVMKYEKLPYGEPIYFKGKYENDILYPLYVQRFSCSFELKQGKIPTIQIKNNISFLPNEYVKTSNGDIITLTLNNVDFELFLENYNITSDILYDSGFKFKCVKGLFSTYIDYWTDRKIQSKKDKNDALYQICKLMLNSLYGKFGVNPLVRGKFPYLDNGVVKYELGDEEIRNSVYLPVASFITSYARRKTITTSQKIRDYTLNKYGKDLYLYSDTDSIHCLIKSELDKNGNIILPNDMELFNIIEIDDYKLGAWKLESRFKKARFLRQKCYIELAYDDKLNTTIAGLPKKLADFINFDNFNIGYTTESITDNDMKEMEKTKNKKIGKKLQYKHVKGGVILVETDFTIK